MLVKVPAAVRLPRSGVAAIEFALIAPVLATLIIGVFDITKILILQQEVINTAHSVSLTASWRALKTLSTANTPIPFDDPPNANGVFTQRYTIAGTTTLTANDVQQIESDIYAEIPWLRSGVENGNFSVTLSGVLFSGYPTQNCQPYSTCTGWAASVAWSVPYTATKVGAGTQVPYTRACSTLTDHKVTVVPINTTTPLTIDNLFTTLRTGGITDPDPILVADVTYTYIPLFPFWKAIFPNGITLVASAYWPVRAIPFNADPTPGGVQTNQLTLYDLASQDPTHHCPYYP